MFGLKFERNENNLTIKDPFGKPIDNNSVELLYYLKFIVNKYLGEVKQSLVEGTLEKINFLIRENIFLVNDLILVFKLNFDKNNNYITHKDLPVYISSFDSLVSENAENTDHPFLFLLAICILGIFPYDHFISREFSLKTSSFLLNMTCKCPLEIFLSIIQVPSLKENMINGVMILISMNIKEGKGSWINLLSSDLL